MRNLASVQRVEEKRLIENADMIEAYRVKGWWVVGKKDEFKEGDLVVYFEIDSWVPEHIAPFLSKGGNAKEYNGVKGNRLRTVKLRGQLSQGLILPLNILPETYDEGSLLSNEDVYQEGEDVTEVLNVQKWEPEIPVQMQGQMKGNFPSFLRKTDQERVQNLWDLIQRDHSETKFEITMKMEGSSTTHYFYNGDFGVCSRNVDLKLDQEGNTFVNTAKEFQTLEKLKKFHNETGRNIALSFELMGPGIQGNIEGFNDHKLFIFDIWDIDKQEYLGYNDRIEIVNEMGLTHVPVLNESVKLKDIGVTGLEDILSIAEGPSLSANQREGVVFKSEDGSFSFKAISNKYLLKQK